MSQETTAKKQSCSVEFETLTVGVPIQNDRVYPREVVEKALKKYQELIDKNIALVTTYSEGGIVNLKDTVGLIKEATIRDNKLVIKMEVLNTPAAIALIGPNGNLNSSLFKVVPLGVGSLKENVVQDDFELIGFHINANYERKN